VPIKNMGEIEIREILRQGMHLPSQSAEQQAREALEAIEQAGRYCCGEIGPAPTARNGSSGANTGTVLS
jgi:hypothetical protein